MFLACDLGNTFAKFGVYEGENLIGFFKSRYDQFDTSLFRGTSITRIGISSVVPELTEKISRKLNESFGILPFVINSETKFNIKINYRTPHSLGIDRICSMEGALSLFKNEMSFSGYNDRTFLITVDLGTASTINIVRYNAEFFGGIIMPGLTMMARALFTDTASLPEVNLMEDYKSFWGNDTRSSIASGIINSTISVIEKSVTELVSMYNAENIKLYITGGNSGLIEHHLSVKAVLVKDLVLRGVKSIYERNFVD